MLGNLFTTKRQDSQMPTSSNQPVQGGFVSNSQVPTQVAQPPVQESIQQSQVVGSQMDPMKRQDLSALSHLDSRAAQVIKHATDETKRIQQEFITPEQLVFGLLYDEELFKLFEEMQVDPAKLSRDLQAQEKQGTFAGVPTLNDDSKKLLEDAYTNSKGRNVSFIAPEDILLAVTNSSLPAAKMLEGAGVKKEALEEKLEKSTNFTMVKKSVVDRYGIDLTAEARAGKLDPITGRDKEVERLIHILLRRSKNNPIIIGEAGVGKTAIVEGLAEHIAEGKVPADLKDRRIIQIDVASLVAGASHRGEFEERLKSVIKETMASNGQIILFIDEVHTLIGAGDSDGTMDASNIIKPYLARGQIQIIGTTTTAEYRKHFEKDKAFQRRFQPIIAEEPSEDVAFEMLKVLRPKYEKFHSVSFPDDTLKSAVHLSKKYIGERYLPDKGVDLMDEAGAEVKLSKARGKRQDTEVKKSDVEKVVSDWTGIPITKLTEDESKKLLELEKLIHQRLIDQEEAVAAVSEAVRRGRIGLASANRPIASFVFLGPTGVGKTELAKTLAEILFGRDDAIVRLDMSEYMEKHEVAKLIGAPPGYVGYEEGGQLTEAVRAKPYSIVLFDEVEKAHPDVFNMLLQILEDGRLTDNKGNTISFKNTIIIATSNIGSDVIQKQLSAKTGKETEGQENQQFAQLTATLTEELQKFFRPELLNRFDSVVIFKPLREQDMAAIAKLGVEKTGKLLKEQGFGLHVSDPAIAALAKDGFDPVYGARPLRRLIQTAIENPIALQIISKAFIPGDTIEVDYDSAKADFVFKKGGPVASQTTAQASNAQAPSQLPTPGQEVSVLPNSQTNAQAQSPVQQTSTMWQPGQPEAMSTPPTSVLDTNNSPNSSMQQAVENLTSGLASQAPQQASTDGINPNTNIGMMNPSGGQQPQAPQSPTPIQSGPTPPSPASNGMAQQSAS